MIGKVFIGKMRGVHFRGWAIGLLIFILLSLIGLPGVGISETRHHESHVHGIGQLNIALAGNDLQFELRSPSANIVGFEHAPETEQQKEKIHEAVELLEDGKKQFALPKKAQCSLKDVHVETDMAHDEHDHGSDSHDSHHGENEDAHSEKEESHKAEHSEFEASYHFECMYPEKLNSVEVLLFANFPGFEELEVQLLTPKQQTAVELTPKNNHVSF